MKIKQLVCFLVLGVVSFTTNDLFGQGAQCSQCGPGAHWVDACASGTDQIANNGAVVGIDTTLDGNLDCQVDMSIVLSPCTIPNNLLNVSRSGPLAASVNFPTVTGPPGHVGPDVIDTEIVSMCLTNGVTLKAGFGTGNGGVLGHSYGTIAERTGEPALADSFFDVFFEVNLGGGNFAYNQTPMRIQAVINCVPPSVSYIHPTGCLPLYTSPSPGQGVHVANLVSAEHRVNLISSVPSVNQWGLIIFTLAVVIGGSILVARRHANIRPV